MLERPIVGSRGRTKHNPLVKIVGRRDLLDAPPDVRDEERDRSSDTGQLVVVEEDDSVLAEEPAEIPEVDEDTVEAMVPVHDGDVEAPPFLEEGGQCDLGRPRVELDEIGEAGFVEELQADVAEA